MSSLEQHYYKELNSFEMTEKKNSDPKGVKQYPQFIAAFIANLSSFSLGTTLGWTSPINSKLLSMEDSPLSEKIDEDALAWIGSIIAIGALIAPFAAGILADKIGRKWTLLLSTVFFVLAYILLLTTKSVTQIMIARLFQGFGTGFVMTAQPMYVGEISTDDCRGSLGSLMQLFIVGGILYVYVIGPYVTYYALQWACIVLPIIFAISFFFMPESPYYYIAKGKRLEALKALKFLRGQSAEDAQHELTDIQNAVEESMRNKGSFSDILTNKGNLKALIICTGLITFQQLSGINVVLFNSQTIFEKANTGLDPSLATILVGIVQVIASGCTPILADRLGRRTILFVSSSVMALGLGFLGLYFYFLSTDVDVSQLQWLPITSLIIFVIVYCVGFGPLPWAVLGEMFPSNVKSIASSIVASTCWILGFLVTRYYATIDTALGTYWVFWLFAIFCGFGFVFVLLIVMETKGLSLQEIQNKLNGR